MIFVNDMTKARWFYSELLGLQTLLEQENKLVFDLDGCQLIAFKCEKTKEIGDYSNEARTVLVFEVVSVEQTYKEMKERVFDFCMINLLKGDMLLSLIRLVMCMKSLNRSIMSR